MGLCVPSDGVSRHGDKGTGLQVGKHLTRTMGLLAFFKNLLNRPAAQPPQAASVPDIACLIDNSIGDVLPVLVTGASGSGKSTFVHAVSRRFTDCVVHLHRAEGAVAGFDEAPLLGQWLPHGRAQAEDADLEDILRARPEGLFRLEMPAQSETTVDMGDLFNGSLMSGVLHWEASRAHGPLRTLTLIVEEGMTWLPQDVLTRLVAQSRAWQLRVVLVEQDVADARLWANFGHVVAFKTMSPSHAQRLASWLEEPVDRLRSLQQGFGLYRSVHWKQAHLGAQLFSLDSSRS